MTDHPDDLTLRRWLESGKPTRVARHLDDGCEACLDRLDALSDLGAMRGELVDASAPPVDLNRRTTGGVQSRIAAEEAALSLLELFALPWHTAAAIFGAPLSPVDGSPGADHHSDDDGEQADE